MKKVPGDHGLTLKPQFYDPVRSFTPTPNILFHRKSRALSNGILDVGVDIFDSYPEKRTAP